MGLIRRELIDYSFTRGLVSPKAKPRTRPKTTPTRSHSDQRAAREKLDRNGLAHGPHGMRRPMMRHPCLVSRLEPSDDAEERLRCPAA